MPVPIVTIFGGSGFIGRYVAQRMARAGWRVRVAVRRPNEAHFVRPYGFVGQVEPIQANVRDEASTRRVIQGAQAVVNCVGVLSERGPQTFAAVVAEAPGRVARIAAEEGIGRLVHISAIGADASSDSLYGAAKARGEAAVAAAFPSAVILRPSIVFGPEDRFFNRFAAMARLSPFLPLVGADTRFQPVYVDDVATAVARSVIEEVPAGVYELGGPEVATFRELMRRMLAIIRRRRVLVAIPFGPAGWIAGASGLATRLSFGLVEGPLTRDQVRQLRRDNVVAPGARGLEALGITPTAMDSVLESYLYAYRPAGQYTEIQESAVRMR
jgi:NADH dehydrogenase